MNDLIEKQCVDCFQRSELFDVLTTEQLDRISSNKNAVRFRAGEMIYKQGTTVTNIVSISSGLAKIYIEGVNDRNLILSIIKPMRLVVPPGMYVDNKHHFSISTLEDTLACFIDADVIREVTRENIAFAEGIINLCGHRAVEYFYKFVSLTQKQMHGRLADVLLYLQSEIYEQNPFVMKISRQEIGELSNMSTESASRIINEFKEDGIIALDGKKVEVLDKNALMKISLTG